MTKLQLEVKLKELLQSRDKLSQYGHNDESLNDEIREVQKQIREFK